MKPTTKDAYYLMHQGAIALAQVEANGIKIDTAYVERAAKRVTKKIKVLEERLRGDDVFKTWRSAHGLKTNLGSDPQLTHVLFDLLKHPYHGAFTKTGRMQANDETIRAVGIPFTSAYLQWKKLGKLQSTYLKAVQREVVDGYLHPNFNLHTVETHRSSSSDPNFQNIPMRNAMIRRIIRRCFVARDGRVLVEIDYGALEFKVAADFWCDEGMINYASDPNKDIHQDAAAWCYKCKPDQVSKEMRSIAKNQFVFPILYGSYYLSCCVNLWEAVGTFGLKLKDGTPLFDWLASKGIQNRGGCVPKERPQLGTFEAHLKKVEEGFYQRFPTFASRKDQWWADYVKRGWFDLMTGFRISGAYSRNFIMNAPIQGPGFHCLLWSLIRIQKWLTRHKLKTKIVGQIHDCLLLDCPLRELQDVLHQCRKVMTEKLQQAWSWVIVPMSVEVDVTPEEDGSWYDKKPWTLQDGVWVPKGSG